MPVGICEAVAPRLCSSVRSRSIRVAARHPLRLAERPLRPDGLFLRYSMDMARALWTF